MSDFTNFEILEDGIIQDRIPEKTWSLWSFMILLASVFFSMLIASFIICLVNTECRTSVPTIHVLLSSKLTGPFAFMALSASTYLYFILCFALYHKTNNKFLIATSLAVYASIAAILVVFPFTGWDNNWGIFLFIVVFLFWMVNVAASLRHTYRSVLQRIQVTTIVVYTLCSITYIVLKILKHTLDINVGLLVVEMVGTVAIIVYMFICLLFVKSVKITVHPR